MIKGKNGHSGLKTRTESAYSLPFGLQNESTPATRSDENMLRTPVARSRTWIQTSPPVRWKNIAWLDALIEHSWARASAHAQIIWLSNKHDGLA